MRNQEGLTPGERELESALAGLSLLLVASLCAAVWLGPAPQPIERIVYVPAPQPAVQPDRPIRPLSLAEPRETEPGRYLLLRRAVLEKGLDALDKPSGVAANGFEPAPSLDELLGEPRPAPSKLPSLLPWRQQS